MMTARLLAGALLVIALSHATPAFAQPAADDDILLSTGALEAKIAVIGFDALGMDAERVTRLEALFRNELARLARNPMPSRRTIEQTISNSKKLRRCTGEDSCLGEIGEALGVDVVVTGNVAALGDSYVLNIKVVQAGTGKRLGRIASQPLRGNPDELIDAVRLAAYRLLAPEQLLGSITVLSDLVGATVYLDDKEVGKTPLPGPIYKLQLGEHKLDVKAADYRPFQQTVNVRFQKTTRVVVRLATEDQPVIGNNGEPIIRKRRAATPWYGSRWFYIGVGVTAAVVGGLVGYQLANDTEIDCSQNPMACQ